MAAAAEPRGGLYRTGNIVAGSLALLGLVLVFATSWSGKAAAMSACCSHVNYLGDARPFPTRSYRPAPVERRKCPSLSGVCLLAVGTRRLVAVAGGRNSTQLRTARLDESRHRRRARQHGRTACGGCFRAAVPWQLFTVQRGRFRGQRARLLGAQRRRRACVPHGPA